MTHLRGHGVTDRQMIDAGLVIEPEDRGRALYDRFRNRVIIPIQDMKGRVVAFGGRVLDPEAKPKYLNSPETPLFHKGHVVFNGHRAREAAFKSGTVIATEGYLDAIAVWQAGLRHVVATLGTAFTEEQIATLWRFAPEPVICFDGDKAGVAAANRAIDRILPALKTGFSFRFAFLPEGQDPDDLIRAAGSTPSSRRRRRRSASGKRSGAARRPMPTSRRRSARRCSRRRLTISWQGSPTRSCAGVTN